MSSNEEFGIGAILGIMLGIFITVGALPLFAIIGAFNEATIFNEKYGTSYTGWNFFFAGKTIKYIIHAGPQKTDNLKIDLDLNDKTER